MSVGAGKTALGVLACLAFTRRRALVVTPGSVIRGTFDHAFDHDLAPQRALRLARGPAHSRQSTAQGPHPRPRRGPDQERDPRRAPRLPT